MSAHGRIASRSLVGIVLGVTLALAGCNDETSTQTTSSAASPSTTSSTPSQNSSTTSVEQLVLQGAPPTTVLANSPYYFQPKVSASSTLVVFSITGKPQWAQFDSSTGALSGTPGTSDEGTTGHIVISARNDTSTASLAPFVVSIKAQTTGTATATITWTAPTENTDGSPVTNLAGYQISYGTNPQELNSTVTVNDASATSYVLKGLDPGDYYFVVVAFNSSGASSAKSNLTDGNVGS